MDRLDFSLPEFTRIIWSSERARAIWQSRLNAISIAWNQVERHSVVRGLRPGGLQSIGPDDLLDFQAYCLNSHLNFVIVSQEGAVKTYGNASSPRQAGQPWVYRVYFGVDPRGFLEAWRDNHQRKIGENLGYPACCSNFFQKYWTDEGWRDLTYPMAEFKNGEIEGFTRCNLLLRHLGVRSVFHLPCSFGCADSNRLATEILKVGIDLGYEKEMFWIDEMLDWPMSWSSLHGVAIVTTPVVRIIASTDALAEKAYLHCEGKSYPDEGATGSEFPFQLRRSLLEGIKDTWTDNGFSSYSTQKQAHDLIIAQISMIMLNSGRVLDLGCGNGLLLERINKEFDYLIPHGVEFDPARYWKAKERIGDNIAHLNLFNIEAYLHPMFELTLVSLNRFKEVPVESAEDFLLCLREKTKYLIVYSYEGWYDYLNPILEKHFDFVGQGQESVYDVRILKPK